MRATIKTSVRLGQRLDWSNLFMQLRTSWLSVLLVCSIVFSAFVLIYVKDLNRRLFIESQTLQQQHQRLVNKWGKLLLEQSTWSAQSRVQAIAARNMDMVMPTTKQVVLLNDKE